MKMLLTILTIFLVLSAISVVGFLAFGRENTWQLFAGNPDLGPFDLTTIERNRHPNDALLCTPALCPATTKADKDLPSYEMSAAEIIESIDHQLQQSGMRFQRVDDVKDPTNSRYVIRTNFMRFPDTNQFQAITLPDGKTGLIAYGRAQIGFSDLGVNLQRLVKLTEGLR